MKLLISFLATISLPAAVNSAYINEYENPLTDEKALLIMEDSVKKKNGNDEKGTFIIGCLDMKGKNKTIVMFSTPTFNTTKPQDILVRFDKKNAVRMLWTATTDGRGFNLPSSSIDKFINNILNHSKLAIQWKMSNSMSQNLVFNLKGLKKEIKKGRKAGCNFNF